MCVGTAKSKYWEDARIRAIIYASLDFAATIDHVDSLSTTGSFYSEDGIFSKVEELSVVHSTPIKESSSNNDSMIFDYALECFYHGSNSSLSKGESSFSGVASYMDSAKLINDGEIVSSNNRFNFSSQGETTILVELTRRDEIGNHDVMVFLEGKTSSE